jgi:phosphoglycerol transferase MdoB-like AlkP superfamily enzyme
LCLLFLVTFLLSRLYFITYLHTQFTDSVITTFFKSSYHGFALDLSAIAYIMSLILLLYGLLLIVNKPHHKRAIKIIISLVLGVVFLSTISDTELYKQWGSKFNNQVLVYITHPKEMALSAGSTNWLKTISWGIVLAVLLIFLYRKVTQLLSPIERNLKTVLVLISLFAINFIFMRGGIGVTTISQSRSVFSTDKIENASAVNGLWNAIYYIVNNTERIYGNKFNLLTEKDAKTLFDAQLNSDIDNTLYFKKEKPNIVVIMLESFTAGASNLLLGKNNCTPKLDQLAQENYFFSECYATGDRTEKGLLSILSGYPAQPMSSIIVFPDKMAKLPSISKDLKKMGYQNSFIYGGDVEFASMKSYLIVNDFDFIIDKKNFPSEQLNSKWGVHDGNLFQKSLSHINTLKPPFFTTILTLSSHEPYEVPYSSGLNKNDPWYAFKNSIMYADSCLCEFINQCKKEAWYNNTLFVLVADHGHDIGLTDIHYFGKQKFQIPLVLLGGALDPTYLKKQNNTVVSQSIIPQLITPIAQRHQYNWQTNSNDSNGFAQYHFYNGFGRVTKNKEIIFDNDSKFAYNYIDKSQKGKTLKDSLILINQSKAYQQILIKDFLNK